MAKARSPNYPAISLPDAIERVRKVYDREHTHKAPPDVIVKAMGYAGLNGKSLTILSALKKYGLLEEVNSDLKVSADGLVILVEAKDSQDRVAAIRRAAFAPSLFEEIRKSYGESVPSDENLRAFLLRRGFLQSAVDAPIRAYRDTIAFVNELPPDNGVAGDSSESEEVETHEVQLIGQRTEVRQGAVAGVLGKPLPIAGVQVGSAIPVSADCSMTIIANGVVTQEGLERLKQYIDLIKTWFPSQSITSSQ